MTVEDFASIGDRLTRALISGDLDLYRKIMVLPLKIEPFGSPAYVLETEAGLAQDFHLYVTAIRSSGITDIWREVRGVTALGDGSVRVSFRIHLMSHAHRVAEPFASEMLLVPHSGSFRIAEIATPAEHSDWTLGKAPLGPASGLM